MKRLKEFSVNLAGLKLPVYQFVYEIEDTFFAAFEHSLIESGNLKVTVDLKNSTSSLDFFFHIEGHIKLTCDVSLEEFDHPISVDNRLIVKLGTEEKEISDEIIMIMEDSNEFNLGSYIYEFIGMQVPYKKVHPKYVTDIEEATLRYGTANETSKDTEESKIDPRWAALKNLNLN